VWIGYDIAQLAFFNADQASGAFLCLKGWPDPE
jgi:hypothetical protein